MEFHRLPAADFDELAAGGGRAETVHRLRSTQLSKRLLAFRAVMENAARKAPGGFTKSDMARSYGIIAAAQRRARAEVDELLLSPGAGVWAMHCLRRLRGTVTSTAPIEDDLSTIGSLAVAAALTANLDTEVTVRLRDGDLVLPTFGRLRLGTASGWAQARVAGQSLHLSVCDAHTDSPTRVTVTPGDPAWEPVHRLNSTADGQSIDLLLDDLDPSREWLEDLPVALRADDATAEVWRHRLDEGWQILTRYDPLHAAALAAGLVTVFPLRPTAQSVEFSASSGEAFGAVAMTLPKSGLSFAAALVHEFQHTKLAALLDLVPLFERTEGKLFYAPWRSDPRPLPGLLHGAYAYLGLAGFWGFQRQVRTGSNYAHFEFARWREEVWRVLVDLRLSGSMTPLGIRFLDGMRATVWSYRQAPVPDEPLALAHHVTTDTWIIWRLRNLEPSPDHVAVLAKAWSLGRPKPPDIKITTRTVPGHRGLVHNNRLGLAQLRLNEPKLFQAAKDGGSDVLDDTIPMSDRKYAFGEFTEAAQLYKEDLARDPGRLDAWAGFVLSRRWIPAPGSRTLLFRPEVVRAVHRHIGQATGRNVDPDVVAAWLSLGRGSTTRTAS